MQHSSWHLAQSKAALYDAASGGTDTTAGYRTAPEPPAAAGAEVERSGRPRRTRRPRRPGAFRTRTCRVLAWLAVGAFVLVGGLLTAGGVLQATSGGYFSTSTAPLSTPTSALVTREIEVGSSSGHPANPSFDVGDVARVRIRVTGQPGQHIFIGITSVSRMRAYLAHSSYDEMQSYKTGPLRVTYHRWPGTERPAAPATQQIWVAQASGTGTVTLEWNKRGGAWAAIAMNADGSPGVAVRASIGLRFGFLLPLGTAILAVGVLGAVGIGVRRRVVLRRVASSSLPTPEQTR